MPGSNAPDPATTTADAARRTTRAFLWLHGLRWLPIGFIIPIIVLVPTERGLDLPTVGLVFAVYGATTALLELPTGGLADAVGRKPVLLAATAADAGLALAIAFGATAWHFVAGALLGGIGRALLSGPLESWYVDTVRGIDPGIPLRLGLARAGAAEGVALATGALLSAILPTIGADLPVDGALSQLTLPAYGALLAQAVSFVAVLFALHEPRRRADGLVVSVRAVPAIVGGGLRLAASTRDLRLLCTTFVLTAIAMVGVEVLWQPRFTALLGGASRGAQTFGYVVVAMSAGAALGAWSADRLPGVLARRAALAAACGAVLTAAAMVGLAAAGSFAVAVVAFVGVYVAGAVRGVSERELLHERVPADRRATMVSVQSLTEQVGNVIASLGLTRLAAAAGIPAAWVVGAGLLVVVAVVLTRVDDRAGASAAVGSP